MKKIISKESEILDNILTFLIMYTEYSTPFSKVILTAVFAGIITTLICLGYDVAFREKTGFTLSELINVSSLIFMVNLIFLFFGLIYYWFLRAFKRGDIVYIVVLGIVTAFTAMKSIIVHRSDDPLLNSEFRQLLMALVIIIGVAGALGIPGLFHSKKFQEHVI